MMSGTVNDASVFSYDYGGVKCILKITVVVKAWGEIVCGYFSLIHDVFK